MTAIVEIIEEIESMTEGDKWTLSLDSVLAILGVSREELYRSQYAKRKRHGMNLDGFGPDNVGRLLEMLAEYGYRDAPEHFQRAGVYFSPDLLQEWQEFFLSVTSARLMGHMVDRDELENALSACRNPIDGLDFYCETRFRLEDLVRFASSLFLRKHGIEHHSLSAHTLDNFVLHMYGRRILKREDLFATLRELLIEKGLEWGFLRASDVRKTNPLPPDLAMALGSLEMPTDEIPGSDRLKRQYRTLLKRYHPDVNPSGLEKTREINTAYTFVIARMHAHAGS